MTNFKDLVVILSVIIPLMIWGGSLFEKSKLLLGLLQQGKYSSERYFTLINRAKFDVYSTDINLSFGSIGIISIIYIILSFFIQNYFILCIYIVLWIGASLFLVCKSKSRDDKVCLDITPRIKRLFLSYSIINITEIIFISIVYIFLKIGYYYYPIILFTLTVIDYNAPYNLYLANTIVLPIERRVNKKYYNKARKKIEKLKKLNVIGITGSFGKTSTKFITSRILEERYKTLKTPLSYNTPMGISKVINDKLTNDHEIFIVEMGAKYIGDIRELAELTQPQIGLITAIGPSHIETFANVENIMKAKYELIEKLPPDGVAVFNYDDMCVKKLADKTFKEKILYGMENVDKLDIYATDIEIMESGSKFILRDKEGNSIKCITKLLGRHNISNLLAGAAIGKILGLSLKEISLGISKVEPIPHRLQPILSKERVIFIDDKFSSNPISSKAALEVIGQFKKGNKIIVTSGMKELGSETKKESRRLGASIARRCDYVILIGEKATEYIYEGLMKEDYNKEKIVIVENDNEAKDAVEKFVNTNDVVLFENNLPDIFNE